MQSDSLTSFWSPQTLLILVVVFILAYDYFAKNPWKRLPPGPPALPIVGSLPFLGWDVREPLRKMAAKYGDVFTIYLGQSCCVVLNSYDAIKEAFVKHAYTFAGRPPVYFITGITEGYGILSSQGPFWQEQRRYSLHILRNFGFGRKILQDRILEEIDFFNKELKSKLDVPLDPQPVIQKSVANVIALVTFGTRMEYDDPVFLHYMDILNRTFDILGSSGILSVFPFVRYLPGDFFRAKQLQRDVDFMMSEYKRMVEQHKAATDEREKPSDFISAYLEKMNQEMDNKESTFTERQLIAVVGDLFGAGTETTTTTLVWAVLYMTLNQDIQDRVHKEIYDLIGGEGVPQMEHRAMLPFTEACLLEIQRLGDIVPLGVPHAVTEDTQFKGYFIPEGTTIITNLYSVHRDPEVWPDPEAFKPERFLDEEGKVIRKEQLIPFSLGKRQCLGESLAKMELFLFFTSMMLHFRFRPAPGHPLPDTQGILGATNMPKHFHVLIEARNSK